LKLAQVRYDRSFWAQEQDRARFITVGAACRMMVVLTHAGEPLNIFDWMHCDIANSAGLGYPSHVQGISDDREIGGGDDRPRTPFLSKSIFTIDRVFQ